ncbi:Bax inhibitor-1/YccA family protein [Nocardioides yefusunii]|uniref:Bax inhibitor-1/YccA family protein n=1 Tax=Nocardioides yefusunii TaxID=2500546 RepID=A0ABW1QVQ2_9ACTN|nr:Bax inhibitor-1/YccA family protein [Nocardioides yefusunii]
MQSSNPVFTKNEAFNQPQQTGYTRQADPYGPYGDPSTWGTGAPVQQPSAGRMTIDSVVQKTGIVLGIIVAMAVVTWWYVGATDVLGQPTSEAITRMTTAAMVGGVAAFALSMVVSFKRAVSPGLVIAFAVAEGVALGAISKSFDLIFPESGIITSAVIGTIAAFAGTLAAYKYFGIKVTDKFRRGVIAAGFGVVAMSLIFFVLSLFGISVGTFDSGLGLLMSVAGLVLGIFFLILDFDSIEQGIAYGADEKMSWMSAFGLALSLVWIYTNLLRILAYFQND